MKKLITLILITTIITGSLFAGYPQTDVQKVYDSQSYRDFIYFMYNGPTQSEIGEQFKKITDFVDSSSFDKDSKLIAEAQILQLVGEFLIKNKISLDDKSGKSFTEEGLKNLNKVKDLDKNEEALITKSDLLGNYIMISSKYVFSKGMESSKYIDKALKINKTNPRSILNDSEKKMFAPSLFGGDVEKAKLQLKDLITNYQLLPKDAFEAVRNLGIIALKEKKADFASTYFSYAEDIFPNNLEIIDLKSK